MDIQILYRSVEHWQQSMKNLTNGLKYHEITKNFLYKTMDAQQ